MNNICLNVSCVVRGSERSKLTHCCTFIECMCMCVYPKVSCEIIFTENRVGRQTSTTVQFDKNPLNSDDDWRV